MLEARPITSPARFALYLDLSSYPIFEAASMYRKNRVYTSLYKGGMGAFLLFLYIVIVTGREAKLSRNIGCVSCFYCVTPSLGKSAITHLKCFPATGKEIFCLARV